MVEDKVKSISLFALSLIPVILALVFLGWRVKNHKNEYAGTYIHEGETRIPSDSRFGFLGSSMLSEYDSFAKTGAGWIRPHLGPFIWGQMQSKKGGNISFGETDKVVNSAGKASLSILATFWPYAKWDLKWKPNLYQCWVKDEFEYELGEYRCNPWDWDDYQDWVRAVVERYDGDGVDDMPNLPVKIKHWEVLNEPDLKASKEGELEFYKDGPGGYSILLMATYKAVKDADPEAKVVIAGSSGGDEKFLSFWRELFFEKDIEEYFDIANVHSISNDSFDSLNVEPYKKLLEEFGIEKPIWVTEAETFVSSDELTNATQLRSSTRQALSLGAEKIFYTTLGFKKPAGSNSSFKGSINTTPDADLDSKDPVSGFQKIFQTID